MHASRQSCRRVSRLVVQGMQRLVKHRWDRNYGPCTGACYAALALVAIVVLQDTTYSTAVGCSPQYGNGQSGQLLLCVVVVV